MYNLRQNPHQKAGGIVELKPLFPLSVATLSSSEHQPFLPKWLQDQHGCSAADNQCDGGIEVHLASGTCCDSTVGRCCCRASSRVYDGSVVCHARRYRAIAGGHIRHARSRVHHSRLLCRGDNAHDCASLSEGCDDRC